MNEQSTEVHILLLKDALAAAEQIINNVLVPPWMYAAYLDCKKRLEKFEESE